MRLVCRSCSSLGVQSSVFLGGRACWPRLSYWARFPLGILPLAVAYGGDMFAALFALIALLALHSHLAVRPAGWKVVLVGVSLLLALFAKESALGAPIVLAIDAIWIRTRSSDQNPIHGTPSAVARRISWGPVALAIAVPSALYASARLAAGLHGIYVLEDLPTRIFGIPRLYLEPLRFGLTAFFPVETDAIKEVVTGSVTGGCRLALSRVGPGGVGRGIERGGVDPHRSAAADTG